MEQQKGIHSFLKGTLKYEISSIDDLLQCILDLKEGKRELSEFFDRSICISREDVINALNTSLMPKDLSNEKYEAFCYIKDLILNLNNSYVSAFSIAKLQNRINNNPKSNLTKNLLIKCILHNKLMATSVKKNIDFKMIPNLIIPFNKTVKCPSQGVDLVGGKGAGLISLHQKGFNCPKGYILTTNMLDNIEDFKDTILLNFDALDRKFVAVRSSASKEDGESDSFAGIFDTYLYVDRNTLLEKINACYNSVKNERFKEYCCEKGIDESSVKMAVIIQEMLDSEVSGVAFSQNPVSEEQDEILIESCFGLGEELVSGNITGDSYIVSNGDIVKSKINIQNQMGSLGDGCDYGSSMLSHEIGSIQKMADQYIYELADLCKEIETQYGFPVDIERALEKGILYILQVRPITTATSEKKENFTKKNTEMFIKETIDQKIRVPLKNVSPFIQGSGRHQEEYIGKYYEDNSKITMLYLMDSKNSVQFLDQTKPYMVAKEVFSAYICGADNISERKENFSLLVDEINLIYKKRSIENLRKLEDGQLLDLLRDIRDLIWNANGMMFFSIVFDRDFCESILDSVGVELSLLDKSILWQEGFDMVEDSFHVERIKEYCECYSDNKDSFLEELQYFTATYFNVSALGEVEKEVQNFESVFIKDKSKEEVLNEIIIEKDKRLAVVNASFEKLSENGKKIAIYMQEVMSIRDKRKNPLSKGFTLFFRIAQILFEKADIPYSYIPYCSFQELLTGGVEYLKENRLDIIARDKGWSFFIDYNGNYSQEKTNYNTQYSNIYEHYLQSNGLELNELFLKGTTGSPGLAIGKVRIIEVYKDGLEFDDGDILVTGMTRPEFLPIIRKASGVITNEGSITCHAAVICREMQIPCLIGTKNGTNVYKEGDIVKLDATNGKAYLLNTDSI